MPFSGGGQYLNEVVWHYRRWTAGQKHFQRMHDVILRYAKSKEFKFNVQYEPYGDWVKKDYRYVDEDTGKRWRWHTVKGKRYKVYLEDEERGVKLNDVWIIPYLGSTAKERVGYPTQKPLALLERIIAASSNEGDVVLDPFAGCATACVAAERLGRHWIGIDLSSKAVELVNTRLAKKPPLGIGPLFHKRLVTNRTDIPQRTDLGALPPYRSHKATLYGLQSGNCAGCGHHFEARHFDVDHIVPQAKGGTDHIENLQLLCSACNRVKGDRGMDYLRAKLQLAA